jgi:hypothetical protein
VEFDPLIGLGLAGLLILPVGRSRATLWMATAILLVVVLAIRDPAPLFRAAVPILPLAALGLGSLAIRVVAMGRQRGWQSPYASGKESKSRVYPAPLRLGVLVTVVLAFLMIGQDVHGVQEGFPTGLSPVLPRSTTAARQLARWINAHTRPTDLVIAMPTIAWLFTARTTEILQAVAITGTGTSFYPSGLARSRFRYDTRLSAARFLVVDDYTRWAITQLAPERILVDRAMRTWRMAYHQGEYAVFANPADHPGG